MPATFADYSVDVDGEADWELANVNTAQEPLEHSALITRFMEEVQQACWHADAAAPSSMIDVVDFALWQVSASVAGDVFSIDVFRSTLKMSEVQFKYEQFVSQLISLTFECSTRRSLLRERVFDNIIFQALLDTSEDQLKLLEGQIAVS